VPRAVVIAEYSVIFVRDISITKPRANS
jgi:hypothetical protein